MRAKKYSAPDADVADESQNVEQVAGIERVNLALHGQPGKEHREDRRHQQQPANPAALNEVSEAGKKPSCQRRNELPWDSSAPRPSPLRCMVAVFCGFAIR